MPAVSVIVPIHNAQDRLHECLDSILGQTLEDIEVLCVDDGSTDGSMGILTEYARRDPRILVLRQENAGAGAARNTGLSGARGEYLAFLDADDSFEPTLLEKMLQACRADSADVAVCGARHFDGRTRTADWLLKTDMLPATTPFSRRDIPDHILIFTSSVPWNKLFRRAFVVENGLKFQEIRRANDLYFTSLALVRASRITIVDEYLVNYRVGQSSSLQATNHETPVDFCRALLAVKESLVASGEFAEVERSFVNDALLHCIYNLDSAKSLEAFVDLYHQLQDKWISTLHIGDYPKDFYLPGRYTDRFMDVLSVSPEEYLFRDTKRVRRQLSDTRLRLKEAVAGRKAAEVKLERVFSSRSYRLGQSLTSLPRWLRRKMAAKR